ncbi:MAG: VWA domain-containing protein [Pyrinomonadaceae bacterium]
MKTVLNILFLLASFSFLFVSSIVSQSPSSTPVDDERPVKITTNLIQVDVSVVGKDGKPVRGLRAEDFRVFQDGREQKISAVTYVDEADQNGPAVRPRPSGNEERKIGTPPTAARSWQGRVVTFVVDDGNCLATPIGTAGIRDAIKRFVDEQMRPDDRVAIYRTATGSSMLQTYTSNKEVIKRLAGRISLIGARGCGSTYEAFRDNSTIKFTGSGAESFENAESKKAREDREDNERRNQIVGTLGVLEFVVERLKGLPQRKAIFLMSEGIAANFKDDTYERLRDLADTAARSSVVIHTMSAKGVIGPGFLSAQDEVLPGIIGGQDNTGPASEARAAEERALSEGLGYLAYQTGGRFVQSSNRLEVDVERILDGQSGFYLVAYEPDDETFKGKDFHRIEVKLARPDLSVASRKGFLSRTDVEARPVIYRSQDGPLFQAIASPFSEPGIDIRPTLLTGRTEKEGPYIRLLFHLSGSDLALVPDGTGRKGSIDVVAVILDEKARVAAEFNRTYPIRVPAAGVATVERGGVSFVTDIPLKKAGIYSARIAVRNNTSKKLGSAGEVIEIPEAKSGEIRIGGLVATGLGEDGRPMLPAARPINAAFGPVLSAADPAVRRFTRGSTMAYAYSVYNPGYRSGGPQPQLTKELKLFRNSVEIAAVPEAAVNGRIGVGQVDDSGVIRIAEDTQTGEYILQVIVRDRSRRSVASHWIDFEVVDRP